jgi:CheY-like chemotaxis protein/prolyl-tRNA editing enzyme YbaK/EbsC (Cys-tRNA(Pro) deacylase)
MSTPRWLQRILTHYGVAYEEHHHPPVCSALRLAEAEHISGYRVAKAVFLVARNRPVAVVVPACARVDLASVQAVLGSADLRFASEEEISRWFKGCQPGSVPPLRLRGDQDILMDRSLACLGNILLPAGTQEDAVAMRFRDWWRMVGPGTGHFTLASNGHANGQTAPSVLVVEDEMDVNHLLCELLALKGFACHGVVEGQQALALAPKLRPSAIVLDLMLPDMSGFEVYERLQRTGSLQRTPVIILTALTDEASRQRGYQLGADAYLTKPFTPDTLVEELHTALADAQA